MPIDRSGITNEDAERLVQLGHFSTRTALTYLTKSELNRGSLPLKPGKEPDVPDGVKPLGRRFNTVWYIVDAKK